MIGREWAVMKGFAAVAVVLVSARCTAAAEIRLRAECRPAGALVTLGDLAEVLAPDEVDAAELAAVELFPSPPPGTERFFRAREIQDLLFLRGVSLVDHRLSGASQVAVLGREELPAADSVRTPSRNVIQSTEEAARQAIVAYLQQYVSADEPWTVDLTLTADQVGRIAAAEGPLLVRGGRAPWVGVQPFELTFETASGAEQLAVEAQVTLPPPVVVTARSLGRGTVIGPADVQLQRGRQAAEKEDAAFHSLEDVVGMETSRSVAAGSVLEPKYVRRPLLVRRGDLVTVIARSGGIRVRTTARARHDASLGDLVAVESLETRKEYYARVSGSQQVEVYARPTGAERVAAADAIRFDAGPEQPVGWDKPRRVGHAARRPTSMGAIR